MVKRPVQAAGIIDAEAHPARPHRLRQLAHEIPRRAPSRPMRVLHRAWPQAIPVMMLGHEHDVAGARRCEEMGPHIRIERRRRRVEGPAEVLIVRPPIPRGVMRLCLAARHAHRVLIPFGIRQPRERMVIIAAEEVGDALAPRRPRRDRPHPPMDENTQLRPRVPIRAGPARKSLKPAHPTSRSGGDGRRPPAPPQAAPAQL